MHSYDEHTFRSQVDSALKAIRRILDVNRHPTYPAGVFHKYDDKYMLADFLTNAALAAQMNCLELLGVSPEFMKTVLGWAQERSVTLRVRSEQTCTFVKSKDRKVETPTLVTESTGVFGNKTKTQKIVEKVTDYYWKYSVHYEVILFKGNNTDVKVVLKERTGECDVISNVDESPYPSNTVISPIDVNITQLLSLVNEKQSFKFAINRNVPECRTPRRNPDVEAALRFFNDISNWASRVDSYFTHEVFPAQQKHDLDLGKINDNGVFIPVLPLFEDRTSDVKEESDKKAALVAFPAPVTSTGFLLSVGDLNLFLAEQQRGLEEKFVGFQKMFPDDQKLITFHEAKIIAILKNMRKVCQHYSDGVDYIEGLLRTQLIAAIGREVEARDFSAYMLYHYRKIFRPEFQPRPFSYAIRQPVHDLEGVIEITNLNHESVYTLVRHSKAKHPMKFSICAGTEISFLGDRFVHTYVTHQFSFEETRDTPTTLNFTARARQFSCFMLMIGTIGGPDLFEPKYAIIIKNKDDLKLPLILEQDAIESLSPEQQRFAKAYRSMQLAGTLFAVCVLQIRPQLEKLLKLPHDSLMREIVLTQDLMELFMEYQIPSDLLSYDGPEDADVEDKIDNVRSNTQAIRKMIADANARREEEERKRKALEKAERLERERIEKLERERKEMEERTRMIEEEMIVEESLKKRLCLDERLESAPRKPVKYKHKAVRKEKRVKSPPPSHRAKGDCLMQQMPSAVTVSMADAPAPPPVANTRADAIADVTPDYADKPADCKPTEDKPKEEDKIADERKKLQLPTSEEEQEDYTKIPSELEANYEEFDDDNALRPTTIKVGETWTRESQKTLLSPLFTAILTTDHQEDERRNAFDLLDALSRSGCLSFGEHASLHVIICATNAFDRTIMDTVICDNVNPIEKMERSLLIVATTVHKKTAQELVKDEEMEKVRMYSSRLFAPKNISPTTKPEAIEDKMSSKKGKGKEKVLIK